MLLELLVIIVILIAILFGYFKRAHIYWKNIGVAQLNPKILIGDFYDVLVQKHSIGEIGYEMYKTFKSKGLQFGGVYVAHVPIFVPVDSDIIKSMLHKEFQHFTDRGIYLAEDYEPLSANLFSKEGEKWKLLRTKLSPAFTSSKMKGMFNIVSDIGKKLMDTVTVLSKEPVDVKEILACFTTDVIASCAFGIECDSLNNPTEEFRKYGRKAFAYSIKSGFKNAMITVAPEVMKLFRVPYFDDDVSSYFLTVVKNNLNYREVNKVKRQDFFNLLIQLKNKGGIDDDNVSVMKGECLSFNELAAEAFIFYRAGFETSSTVMTFVLYELSQRLDVQRKVRSEICTVLAKHRGEITYESLNEVHYLEAVINGIKLNLTYPCRGPICWSPIHVSCNNIKAAASPHSNTAETMRLNPPGAFLIRICTQDYQIPGTDIIIKKGTRSLISVKGLHMDPEHFPNPEVFDPDRFLEHSSLPFVFMPFGSGPRICIGMRFGLMQTKIGLISLLRNFEITLNRKTKPLRIDPQAFVTSPKDSIYLNFRKL